MSAFQEMMQKFVNMDYTELMGISQAAMRDVIPACQKLDTKTNGVTLFTSILLSAIGADGKLSVLEKKFLTELLGMSNEQVSDLIKLYQGEMAELTDTFVDSLDDDTKSAVITLCLCICSVDEKISREETAFIRKLME